MALGSRAGLQLRPLQGPDTTRIVRPRGGRVVSASASQQHIEAVASESASNAQQQPASSRRALLGAAAFAAAALAPRAARADSYLLSTGAKGLLAEEEAKLLQLRQELEGDVRRELEADWAAQKADAETSGKLCVTPFGIDVVGITEFVALVGALVGGVTARQRKAELERLNEQLRKVNMSLRQQARAGMVYAPGLTYAPPAPEAGAGNGNGAAAAAAAAQELAAAPAAAAVATIVGVFGTGAIGAEAARIFKGIGMRVLAYDVNPNPKVKEMGIPYMPWEEILPQCDVVSLHMPLLPATRYFIDARKIAMMRPGVTVLNVSRGGLIDTNALLEGVRSGHIGGVGLDVYEREGSLFFQDLNDLQPRERMVFWDTKFQELVALPQVLVTPHTAFLTSEALANIAGTTIENLDQHIAAAPLTNEVLPPRS
ncbi:D-lactate dehydrogenase [Raphidocelis subcapitata]|uniref:D-lactate dehydrogenase n=1 Tax=Raphidocelis subcapitata TaxID=307507 RepID=A0A2V0NVN6_9CHLO|nr:D-lactate dehydrogenase [Raphidocelis subcapitata]|eukprot:GBF89630.1 D-lactate dehydrogenase [Raphidocelis subcapitata]